MSAFQPQLIISAIAQLLFSSCDLEPDLGSVEMHQHTSIFKLEVI